MDAQKTVIDYILNYSNGNKPCVIDKSGVVSYSEFSSLIKTLAVCFKDEGIKKGDRVVIISAQTSLYLAAFHGLQYIGAIPVPLEKNSKPDNINAIVKSTEAVAVISHKPLDTDAKVIGYESIEGMPIANTDLPPDYCEVADILFTTGTTGKSKGVVMSHRADIAVAENVAIGVEKMEDEVEIIPMPLNHAFGLRRYFGNVITGATSVLLDGVINMKACYTAIEEYGVTAIALNPAALEIILKLSKAKLADYKTQLRYVQLGSAHLSDEDKRQLIELLPESRLYNFYGSTEAGCSSIIDFNKHSDKPNCIGKPTEHSKFAVLGENGEIIKSAPENKGRLICGGAMCMDGYYKDQDLTDETVKDGYVYSNDLSYIDSDGFIYLFGRCDDVITCGGNKIPPEEVEDTAKLSGLVTECACVPYLDPVTGAVIPKLFVVAKSDFTPEKLQTYLSGKLEYYMVPKKYETVESLPKTFNGKILRKQLIEGDIPQ